MFGYEIGDKVKYKIFSEYRSDHKDRGKDKFMLHEAVVDGFSATNVKLRFPNGYTKFIKPKRIEKIVNG